MDLLKRRAQLIPDRAVADRVGGQRGDEGEEVEEQLLGAGLEMGGQGVGGQRLRVAARRSVGDRL